MKAEMPMCAQYVYTYIPYITNRARIEGTCGAYRKKINVRARQPGNEKKEKKTCVVRAEKYGGEKRPLKIARRVFRKPLKRGRKKQKSRGR